MAPHYRWLSARRLCAIAAGYLGVAPPCLRPLWITKGVAFFGHQL